jgi:MoaA/NifB/PqqE/SkfB family radical SAM enzyme
MRVKIREDSGYWFAYFLDERRLIGVNDIGACILDLYFNQSQTTKEIIETLYYDYDIPPANLMEDVKHFLENIQNELSPTTFSFVEQEQTHIPIGAELEITSSCNLRCIHCLQDEYPEIYIPSDKARWIIDILARSGIFEISVIGGEPFKHPDAINILKHCIKRELVTTTVTNGLLLTDKHIKELSQLRLLTVLVSLEGPEKVHDIIRGDGTFVKVDHVLRKLIAAGIDVGVLSTLNAITVSGYRELLEYCNDLGVMCSFNLFKPFKKTQQTLIISPEDFFEAIINLFRLRKSGFYNIGIANAAIVSELLHIKPQNECRAAQSGLVINANGRMLTCPSLFYSNYYQENDMPFFDEHFLETWREHPMFAQFRNNGLRGCQARSFIFGNNVTKPDPYDIDAFRKYLENAQPILS